MCTSVTLECVCVLGHVQLFAMLWTIACRVPLSMGFSRQEYWSGLSFPPLGDLPDPRIKPISSASPALAGRFFNHWAHILECAYHQKCSFHPSPYSWCPLRILPHSPTLFPLVTTRKWSSGSCLPWFIRKPRCPTVGIPSITEQGKGRGIRSNTQRCNSNVM